MSPVVRPHVIMSSGAGQLDILSFVLEPSQKTSLENGMRKEFSADDTDVKRFREKTKINKYALFGSPVLGMSLFPAPQTLHTNAIRADHTFAFCTKFLLQKMPLSSLFELNCRALKVRFPEEIRDAMDDAERHPNILDLCGMTTTKSCIERVLLTMGQASAERFLSEVSLDFVKIGSEGAFSIAKMLRKPDCFLKTLRLKHCAIGDEGGAEICKELGSLEHLDLSDNSLKDSTCKALSFHLSTHKDGLLTFLHLSKNNLGDKGAARVCASFEDLKNLASVSMAQCGLSFASCNALLSLKNSSVNFINLRHNAIADSKQKLLRDKFGSASGQTLTGVEFSSLLSKLRTSQEHPKSRFDEEIVFSNIKKLHHLRKRLPSRGDSQLVLETMRLLACCSFVIEKRHRDAKSESQEHVPTDGATFIKEYFSRNKDVEVARARSSSTGSMVTQSRIHELEDLLCSREEKIAELEYEATKVRAQAKAAVESRWIGKEREWEIERRDIEAENETLLERVIELEAQINDQKEVLDKVSGELNEMLLEESKESFC